MVGFLKKIKDFILFFPKFFYKKVLKSFLIFLFIFGTPFALTYANLGSDFEPTYKVYIALSKLTGTLSENQYVHSSVSSDLPTYLGLIITYISIMSLYLALFLFMYFTVGGLMAYSAHGSIFKADKKSPFLDPAISSRAQKGLAMLIYAVMVMPSFGATVRLDNGVTYQEPIFVFLGKNLLLEVVKRADAIGETDFNYQYDVTDFEVESKSSMNADFAEFTRFYLSTNLGNNGASSSFNVLQSPTFENEKTGAISPTIYNATFASGLQKYDFQFQSNEALIKKGEKLGIDMRAQEQNFINNYFNALNTHATKISKALSETEITNVGGNTNTDDTYSNEKYKSFGQEYSVYCDTIYDKQEKYMSMAEMNYYILISSMCASEDFMARMYDNKFYNYKDVITNNTELNRNYTTYYGLERHNLVLNIEGIIKNTQEICSGESYLACSAAVSYAASKKALTEYKVGSATSLVRSLAASVSINPTDAGTFTGRILTVDLDYINPGFKDLSNDVEGSSVLTTVELAPYEKKSHSNYIAYSWLDFIRFYSIEGLNIPNSTDEIFEAATNLDIGLTFDRLRTCMMHPKEVNNGFRCERITREISRTGLTMIETGARLYVGAHAMRLADKITNVGMKKKKDGKMVLSSTLPKSQQGKFRKYVVKGGAMASAGWFSATFMAPLFESANYKDGTVMTMLGVQLFAKVAANKDLSDMFASVGFFLILKGLFIWSFLLILPYQFFKAFLMLILMVMTKIFLAPIYLPSIITTKGYDGFVEYFKSVLMSLSGVIVCVGLMVTVESYNSILLSFFIKESYEIFNVHITSWYDLLFNAPLVLLMWLIMWLIIQNVFKQQIQENILKDLQQFGMN